MSFDVELLVTFRCVQYEAVAALARKHLSRIEAELEVGEAVAFLTSLAGRTGAADPGPKNGITAWWYGGNYTRPDHFVEVLRPFWDELLRYPVFGGPSRDSHVIVLYQLQDADQAAGLEIHLALPAGWPAGSGTDGDLKQWPLVVDRHDRLPFRW